MIRVQLARDQKVSPALVLSRREFSGVSVVNPLKKSPFVMQRTGANTHIPYN